MLAATAPARRSQLPFDGLGVNELEQRLDEIGVQAELLRLGEIVGSVNGQLAAGYSVRMSRPYSMAIKLKHFLFHTALTVDSRKYAAEQQRLSARWLSTLEVVCRNTNARKKPRDTSRDTPGYCGTKRPGSIRRAPG